MGRKNNSLQTAWALQQSRTTSSPSHQACTAANLPHFTHASSVTNIHTQPPNQPCHNPTRNSIPRQLSQTTLRSHYPNLPRDPPQRIQPPPFIPPRLLQTTLHGNLVIPLWGNEHGHHMQQPKPQSTFRVLSQNINGIPRFASEFKSRHLLSRAASGDQHDITLWQETNFGPSRAPLADSWSIRRRHKQFVSQFSTNERDNTTQFQLPGGTLALCSIHNSSKILDQGADTYGRWSWLRLGDPTKLCTTFLSVYRPNFSKGISSSYQQPVRAIQLPETKTLANNSIETSRLQLKTATTKVT